MIWAERGTGILPSRLHLGDLSIDVTYGDQGTQQSQSYLTSRGDLVPFYSRRLSETLFM